VNELQYQGPIGSTQAKQGAVIGGWICFSLGLLLQYFSLWTFFLYGPLFFVAFVLSIIAMAQRRIVGGLALLLLTLVVPVTVFFVLGANRAVNAMASAARAIDGVDESGRPIGSRLMGQASVPEHALPAVSGVQWTAPANLYDVPASRICIGAQKTLLANESFSYLCFSPDSSHLAYAYRGRDDAQIVVARAAGLEIEHTYSRGVLLPMSFGWSQDGTRLVAFYGRDGFDVIELKTSRVIHLALSVPDFDGQAAPSISWTGETNLVLLCHTNNFVQAVQVDLDRLTYNVEFRAGPNDDNFGGLGRRADEMMPQITFKRGHFNLMNSSWNGQTALMVNSSGDNYCRMLARNQSLVMLAPDSSFALATINDQIAGGSGLQAVYFGVTPTEPARQYTVSLATGAYSSQALESVRQFLAADAKNLALCVYDPRTNPLTGRVLGTIPESYSGDVRIVDLGDESMQVAVSADYSIQPGKVVAGMLVLQPDKTWKRFVDADQVWGTLQPFQAQTAKRDETVNPAQSAAVNDAAPVQKENEDISGTWEGTESANDASHRTNAIRFVINQIGPTAYFKIFRTTGKEGTFPVEPQGLDHATFVAGAARLETTEIAGGNVESGDWNITSSKDKGVLHFVCRTQHLGPRDAPPDVDSSGDLTRIK
jgi:hypothetical protein